MIKANNILPALHLIKRGNKVERTDFRLKGRKKILFFILQFLSLAFGWGVLAYCFYLLFFK